MRFTFYLIGLGFILLLGSSGVGAAVDWHSWASEAFSKAKAEQKLIMIYVGHEGCTACRFMEQNTFSHPKVIELLNEHFVPIQVDSEAEPDIGERYSDWAWPANAVLLPDATQVSAFRGRRFPERYIEILENLLADFAAGQLKLDSNAPYLTANPPRSGPLSDLRDQLRRRQDRLLGRMQFGIFENAEPVRHLLLRHHIYTDKQALNTATRILDGVLNHVDPVWGGLFYESLERWDNILPEKRLENQIAGLQAYADAYQLTGHSKYRQALADIHRYVSKFMRSPEGTFFASTQDRLDRQPQRISMYDYYKLGDRQRRRHGLPTTDRAIYTDLNGRMISAYSLAYAATGEPAYLSAAIDAADHLLAKRITPSGWAVQLVDDERLRQDQRSLTYSTKAKPFLRTQAQFGLGLLALFDVSANDRYLASAKRIALGLRSELEDSEVGGFYAGPADGTPGRRKPLEDNAAAARFLYRLGIISKQPQLVLAAENALRAATSDEAVRREGRITGNLVMALELMTAGYVEFSVVGAADDPVTQALLRASRDVFEPRKLVHIEQPGRYPQLARPALYICNDNACSVPIFDPDQVAGQAANFTRRTPGS